MSQVTFDPAVGGDGSTVADTSDPNIGLGNGGYRTRLVPALAQIVAIAIFLKNKAAEALGYRDQTQALRDQAETFKNAAQAAASTAGGAAAFIDTNPIVKGSADATKQVRIEVDTNVPTASTVVLTAPAANGTLYTAEQALADLHTANFY
ncbi:hypothetical protein ACFQUU_08810 [Herbaspirillum sp. GCM10030257]|uniref:hypothetical protein n=1 Tax=Herbaspirillum sp. GCM10030257 TaxID=3273393 RepID=UPI003610D98F